MIFPTANELRAFPVAIQGQADDLRLEITGLRYWVSRMTVEDGEPVDDKVTIEAYNNGRWRTVYVYDGAVAHVDCGIGYASASPLREKGAWL